MTVRLSAINAINAINKDYSRWERRTVDENVRPYIRLGK